MTALKTDFTATKRLIGRGLRLGSLGLAMMTSAGVLAADLPFFPAGPSQFQAGPSRGGFGGLLPEAVFKGPPRFDVYGHPVYGTVFSAAPGPLYASTGCPAALEPVYDAVGNFAGYSPIQMCR